VSGLTILVGQGGSQQAFNDRVLINRLFNARPNHRTRLATQQKITLDRVIPVRQTA